MLSLGMVGALSIVRYRTAVKSPLDLMFLFWAITTGIAAGAGYYYIAWVAFLFVALVFAVLRGIRQRRETVHAHLELPDQGGAGGRDPGASCTTTRPRSAPRSSGGETTGAYGGGADAGTTTCPCPTPSPPWRASNDVTLVQYRGSYEA